MTKRKFTPPTKFPAEYVDGNGKKAVVLGRAPNKELPFIGYDAKENAASWTEEGEYYNEYTSEYDLHDIPKRITLWQNVYETRISPFLESRSEADGCAMTGRLCVYRLERDEDGGNPEIFVEEV